VRRDGAVTTVAAADVPGDILDLEHGDVIAADARLLNVSSLTCIEALLTGESEAVAKSAETLGPPELPLGDRKNMIFMGTSTAAGSGHAVVVSTGMQTEIGGIATLIDDAGEAKERHSSESSKRSAAYSFGPPLRSSCCSSGSDWHAGRNPSNSS
jgi:Ca2+-transporting ATPase